MRAFTFFIILHVTFFSFGQKKQVCFTIDDLPVVNYGIKDTSFQKALLHKLVLSLKSNNIPAIGFVNEMKLFKNDSIVPFQVELLRFWAANNLDLGNHTYSHPDYNRVSFEKYTNDVLKGEIITKSILNDNGKDMKYFRHPFLHSGNTKEKADSLDSFLKDHGYLVAPVTIDNDDYLFAVAYKRAKVKMDTVLMDKIGQDYIDYMEAKLKYFEQQANRLFGRDICQTLLLHASSLNSDYTDALADMYQRNGYTFVSLDEALKDEAYQSEVSVFQNKGISWMDRWALSLGKKGEFFKDDPASPEYIQKLSE